MFDQELLEPEKDKNNEKQIKQIGVIDKNWKRIVVDFMSSLDPKTESILKTTVFNRSRNSFDISFTDEELE